MIKELIEWYGDIRFPDGKWNYTVEVTDAYWWGRKHMTIVDINPEIEEWLKDNVKGRFLIHYPTFNMNPSDDPRNVPCPVSFSRVAEATMFKLAFS